MNKKAPKLTEMHMAVLAFLGKGKANAKRRSDIVHEFHITDSTARIIISDLRYNEYPIVPQRNGHGYFVAETPEELDSAIAMYKKIYMKEQNVMNALIRAKTHMTYASSI